MHVLIIGGNGFIGHNTATYLLESGYEIGIYDRNCQPPSLECDYYCRDLLNDPIFPDMLKGYHAVIYLISASTPQTSMMDPSLVYEKEIFLLLKFLSECVKSGIRRVIYASSGGTIYGENSHANCEDSDTWPVCHYAVGKLACEKILNLYNQLYGMENVILRISNPYGKGQLPESGVGAVTAFVDRILKGETITLYGDGTTIRDFIDIQYVAQSFRLALEWEFSDEISPVFNIGSGRGISLNQVIAIICDAVERKARIQYCPARSFDVMCNYLDIEKARIYLGYHPPENLEHDIAVYAARLMRGGK